MYYLSESDSFWIGMCIVCQYETISGQVCVLFVSIRQSGQLCVLSVSIKICVFLSVSNRYVFCLSVSEIFKPEDQWSCKRSPDILSK